MSDQAEDLKANPNQSAIAPDKGAVPGSDKSNSDRAPLRLHEVLEEEFLALHSELPPDHYKNQDGTDKTPEERLADLYVRIHKLDEPRAAFCISGGGIRSGTFALGIIQGLARCGMLDKFHYLSTVSGGGYIGGWLTSWIHRHSNGEQGVAKELAAPPTSKLQPEPKPVSHLRDYSNYLSPKLGLLSADTWTLVAIYIRNLLLNWLVLVPLLAATLMVPRIYSVIIGYIKAAKLNQLSNPATDLLGQSSGNMTALLIAGLVLGAVAVGYIGLNRPSSGQSNNSQGSFIAFCLTPMALAAIFITIYWMWYRTKEGDTVSWRYFILFGILVNLLGFTFWFLVRVWSRGFEKTDLKNSFFEFIAVVFTGAFGGWLIGLCAKTSLFLVPLGEEDGGQINRRIYICLAVPVLLSILTLSAMLFEGIISFYTSDEDREWWSRSDAWFLIAILGWAAASSLVIWGPILLGRLQDQLSSAGIASVGGVSGLITILLGRSSSTAVKQKQKDEAGWKARIPDIALKLAAPVFVVFLLILLVLGVTELIKLIDGTQLSGWLGTNLALDFHLPLENPVQRGDQYSHLMVIYYTPLWVVVGLMLFLLLISGTFAFFININRFSLHAMYRNRLIRAYLGASNTNRAPNKFTGFDPNDNIRMYKLWPENEAGKPRRKLLHVVNIALNLVGGEKLAWQQRKAESFTVSPLHSGSYCVGYRSSSDYGGGISLGTAVAISGAAASPNMGYHSSSVITFLMTLFNARLGWWLGNPGKAGDSTFNLEGPYVALQPLIAETLGLTNDRSQYVYLSDGGHFENLGLYEMVLRRCHFIVVSDGSQDEEATFESLGNAVRKIRIDLGVPIEFSEDFDIYSRSKGEEGKYCAIGTIRYSCVDDKDTDGILIYLKPAFYGNEPRDVYEYAQTNPAFPHETTADQFFTESQLESYRMLGSHVMQLICEEGYTATGFKDLLRKSVDYLYPKSPPPWLGDWLKKP